VTFPAVSAVACVTEDRGKIFGGQGFRQFEVSGFEELTTTFLASLSRQHRAQDPCQPRRQLDPRAEGCAPQIKRSLPPIEYSGPVRVEQFMVG
jgi:hypothetical protein